MTVVVIKRANRLFFTGKYSTIYLYFLSECRNLKFEKSIQLEKAIELNPMRTVEEDLSKISFAAVVYYLKEI